MKHPGSDAVTESAEGPGAGGPRDRGLTLVEVLVAMALIGITLVPMVYAHAYFSRVTTETHHTMIAAGLARRCLSHLKAAVGYDALDENTGCTKTGGNFNPPHDDFHYAIQVDRLTGPGPASEVKVIRIKIMFPAMFGERYRTLSCTGGVGTDGSGCDRWDRVTLVSPRS